jgi:hypothetical protein
MAKSTQTSKEWKQEIEEWRNEVNERLFAMEARQTKVDIKLTKLEEKVWGNIESGEKDVASQKGMNGKIGEIGENMVMFEERINKLDQHQVSVSEALVELGDRQLKAEGASSAMEEQMKSLLEEWPKIGEEVEWTEKKAKKLIRTERRNKVTDESRTNEAKQESDRPIVSFADKWKDMKEGTVLLVGDSMVRGVGTHLKKDNKMFDTLDFGGARIEDIAEKFKTIGEGPESHVVVMVGTNNLKSEGTEEIMRKYKSLIADLKQHRYKSVSMIGILQRADTSSYMDSKRMSINIRLKKLCEKNDVKFVDIAIEKETMLDWKGLHLKWGGQDHVARAVFKHCISILN